MERRGILDGLLAFEPEGRPDSQFDTEEGNLRWPSSPRAMVRLAHIAAGSPVRFSAEDARDWFYAGHAPMTEHDCALV